MTKLNTFICSIGLSTAMLAAGGALAGDITGAGATFPYPVYAKWAEAYQAQTGVKMNYQSIGSGGGIKLITAKNVDFGATDAPMTPEELDKEGLTQFPAVMGGVVPVVNLNGIEDGQLKLDGNLLAEIYLGKITKWNDPKIEAINKGLKLPDENIIVVQRSDGSGTTFIFTNYLSKVSPEWKSSVGEGKAVSWKVGTGGKGNEGVAAAVKNFPNAIGYVEYAFALQTKMTTTQLKNRDGKSVKADMDSFKAAAANAHWDMNKGFYEILTDEPGNASWPITGATFILVHKVQDKPETGAAVLKFFDWSFSNGDKMAEALDYVSMPGKVKDMIRASWKAQIKDASGKKVWK